MHACSVVSDSLWPHGLYSSRLFCSWNFPGNNTGVGCHFLPQGIFLTQRSNLHLLHQSLALAGRFFTTAPQGSLRSQYIIAKGGWDPDISTLSVHSCVPGALVNWRASVSLDLKRFRKFLWRSYARLDWKPWKHIIRIFNAGYYSVVPLVEQGDPIRMEVSLEFFSWDIAGWYRRKESFPTKMALITH